MTQLCVSITMHERPDVLFEQLSNLKTYLPENSQIVVHLSLGGMEIRPIVRDVCARFTNVHLNPTMYPTIWGWMMHCHLFNYEFVRRERIPFTHFVLLSSACMLFKKNAELQIEKYTFLSNAEHARVEMIGEDSQESKRRTSWVKYILAQDPVLFRMLDELGSNDIYISQHEGTSYSRDLFEEMYRLFLKHYQFHFSEPKLAREEVYFSTLARLLSNNYSNPIIYMGRCPPPKSGDLLRIPAINQILKCGMAEEAYPHNKADPDFGKNYFGIKVLRDDTESREYIRNLAQ